MAKLAHFLCENFVLSKENANFAAIKDILQMRNILFILTISVFLALPVVGAQMSLERGVAEQIEEQITISVEGKTVYVGGAQGLKLVVVSLTGRQVAVYSIDSPSQRIDLNLSKGCYVLKVGNVVRKVSIQ